MERAARHPISFGEDKLRLPLLKCKPACVSRVTVKVAANADGVVARMEGLATDRFTLSNFAHLKHIAGLSVPAMARAQVNLLSNRPALASLYAHEAERLEHGRELMALYL
jgi:hypothetical protein